MFTVILLRGRAKGIFAQSRTLFEPFEEERLLTLVDWNESPWAVTIDDVLPGLRAAIRGKRDWRAVVVDCPDESEQPATQPDNPFDFIDNDTGQTGRLALSESPHGLVRLAHMLLGYPPIGAKDFEAVYSYKDPAGSAGSRVERRAADLAEPGEPLPLPSEVRRRLAGMHDLKIHYREVEYTAEERKQHDELTLKYSFRGNRPAEVIFVSTRRPPETDPHQQLRAAWSVDLGRVPSQFVARNDYPSGTRFAVYDLLDSEHSEYEQNLLRFWLSILCIAVNDLPASSLQADRVYRLDTEVDKSALIATINTHLSRLGTVRDRIDSVFRNPVPRPRTDVATLLVEQEIPIEFDNLGGESITASTSGYSLASDVPFSESSRWWAEYNRVTSQVEALLRKPRRVLAAAVYDARLRSKLLPSNEIELSRYEKEDLEDDLSRQVIALAAPATARLLDRKSVRGMIDKHHKAILRIIAKRLHARTIGVAAAVAIATWAVGMVPYLVVSATTGTEAFGDAAALTLSSLVILIGGGVAALVQQRGRLLASVSDFNRDLKAIRGEVHGGAAVFGQYLTNLATYMRARALLAGSALTEDQERSKLQGLEQLKIRIARAMDFERGLITSLGATAVVQKVSGDLGTLDVGNRLRMRRLLQLPSPAGLTIPLNSAGDEIKAPYDFVARLVLTRVPLFEQAGDDDTNASGTR